MVVAQANDSIPAYGLGRVNAFEGTDVVVQADASCIVSAEYERVGIIAVEQFFDAFLRCLLYTSRCV